MVLPIKSPRNLLPPPQNEVLLLGNLLLALQRTSHHLQSQQSRPAHPLVLATCLALLRSLVIRPPRVDVHHLCSARRHRSSQRRPLLDPKTHSRRLWSPVKSEPHQTTEMKLYLPKGSRPRGCLSKSIIPRLRRGGERALAQVSHPFEIPRLTH